jgi:hypothetical protein
MPLRFHRRFRAGKGILKVAREVGVGTSTWGAAERESESNRCSPVSPSFGTRGSQVQILPLRPRSALRRRWIALSRSRAHKTTPLTRRPMVRPCSVRDRCFG